ncbi:hypothetical protein PoB_002287200 [Plakobranchus ocellatus]|uniref:Uncharacterized protein n=1 Tax=Plakobranchus ocellatus TaxID=259542 RepID=A0AAV3ZPD0_9GAST|nr:hypothetical protein PoB_002287200 [Plakobranchus ocellatus]
MMVNEASFPTVQGNGTSRRRIASNTQYSLSDEEDSLAQFRQNPRLHQGLVYGDIGLSAEEMVFEELEENLFDESMVQLRNELPSRQIDTFMEAGNWTAKRKRATSIYHTAFSSNQHHEDEIVDSLEREMNLVDSSPADIDEAVRTIPTTLSQKRNIKRRLSSRRRRKLTRRKLIKYWFGMVTKPRGGVGGTMASVSALRSAGTPLSRVRAPPPASWPDGGPESLRSPCCELAIYKSNPIQLNLELRKKVGFNL